MRNAYEDVMAELSRSQTSNKASAIINQSIGIATGCLLIFLAIFIGLSGNTESILIFDLLGYDGKKINRILLDPYMVVSNVIFFITLPICVFAAKRIQISTSLATGDYMPFQLSLDNKKDAFIFRERIFWFCMLKDNFLFTN